MEEHLLYRSAAHHLSNMGEAVLHSECMASSGTEMFINDMTAESLHLVRTHPATLANVIKNAAKLIGQLFTAPTDNDQKHTVKEPNILSLQRNRNIVQWPPKSNHLISTPQSIFSAAEDKTEHRKTYKQEATEDCCSKCLTKSPKR